MRRLIAPAALSVLSACASVPPPVTGDPGWPTGASRGPEGYATIRSAPPAALPATPPPQPDSLDTFARRTSLGSPEEQRQAWAEANGPEDFQREVDRLMQLLPTAEPDNFVELRLARDETSTRDPRPLLGAEVFFKHAAAATLAKYTADPRFFAREGGHTPTEMEAKRQLWLDRLNALGSGWSMSSDPRNGRLEIDLGMTESELADVARKRGWTWGEDVVFRTSPERPAAFADPDLKRTVRIFAREKVNSTIRLTALGTGRIVLDDGCFKLDAKRETLVMFAYDAQLTRDAEGYLVVKGPDGGGAPYRIGEPGAWNAPNAVDEGWPDVRALRKACGDAPILNVAVPRSERTFVLPYGDWVLDYARVNGLTYQAAWDEIMDCYRRKERGGLSGLVLRDACVTQFNRKGQPGAIDPGDVPLPPPPPR